MYTNDDEPKPSSQTAEPNPEAANDVQKGVKPTQIASANSDTANLIVFTEPMKDNKK